MHQQIAESIDSVGFVDWNARDFHGYQTDRGTSYNAFLIHDTHTALIDTVKGPFAEFLLENIRECADPSKIRFIVCNHAETDHAGALPEVLRACPNAEIVCDPKCRDILGRHFDTGAWKFQIVKTGDTLSLGKNTLQFLETPMVHWPESMGTYIPEKRIFFSMDNFGQHYASNGRFDEQEPYAVIMDEAKAYYANILMTYASSAGKTLEKVKELNPEIIAPSHGIIWRKHVRDILSAYTDWVAGKCAPKVLVIYDNMWGSTERMARSIVEGAGVPGVEVKLLYVRANSLAAIAAETLDAAVIAVGSSTLNRTLLPQAAATLTYLKGLRPPSKSGFAFSVYGWSKGAEKDIEAYLREMKFEILREPLLANFAPDASMLEECKAAGRMLAEKALEKASAE